MLDGTCCEEGVEDAAWIIVAILDIWARERLKDDQLTIIASPAMRNGLCSPAVFEDGSSGSVV